MRKLIIKFFIALFLFTILAESYLWVFGYNQYISKLFEWIKNSSNGHIVLIVAIGLIALKIGALLGSLSKKKIKKNKLTLEKEHVMYSDEYERRYFRNWLNEYGAALILPMIALGILAGGIYLYATSEETKRMLEQATIDNKETVQNIEKVENNIISDNSNVVVVDGEVYPSEKAGVREACEIEFLRDNSEYRKDKYTTICFREKFGWGYSDFCQCTIIEGLSEELKIEAKTWKIKDFDMFRKDEVVYLK